MIQPRPRAASPSAAVARAMALLESDPATAARQAAEILKVLPDDARALYLLGAAWRRTGRAAEARPVLERVVDGRPDAAAPLFELGLTLVALGEDAAGLDRLQRAAALEEAAPAGLEALRATHRDGGAAVAFPPAAFPPPPQGGLPAAEQVLRERLATDPENVELLWLSGEVAARRGDLEQAATLLRRALARAEGHRAARHCLAVVLARQSRHHDALMEADRLLAETPADEACLRLRAGCLFFVGRTADSAALVARLLAAAPDDVQLLLQHGYCLRVLGQGEEAQAIYRRALALDPDSGEAYWALADLKTARFTAAEAAALRARALTADPARPDAPQLYYALGKLGEDEGDWPAAFAAYATGAAILRRRSTYDADRITAWAAINKALFTPDFLAAREGGGCAETGPIFITGLPRSGSTLVEQILAGHSQVEATMELPDLSHINTELMQASGRQALGFAAVVAGLDAAAREALGRDYLARAGRYRQTARPFFLDKAPNNFMHAGLLRLILPNARIIDVRRHPMAVGMGVFRQYFQAGQEFTHALRDIGLYYRDYVGLMAHVDAVLPGHVHRVIYEDLVEDTEATVRALLDHCGLAFEPGCLRFWEGGRTVFTHSSEQVRRPIQRDGLEHWRHFAPWLEPLETALGPALDGWRGPA